MSTETTAQHASMYKKTLLDHFHNPRNKGDIDERYTCARGKNPRCGDEVEVGLVFDNNECVQVRFHGRGCIACLSSASIMAVAMSELSLAEAQTLHAQTLRWLSGETNEAPTAGDIPALAPVVAQPARKQCVQLAWNAAATALDALS